MTRALECWDSTIQHPVLICLAPWMENLIISPHWKVGAIGVQELRLLHVCMCIQVC